ncbi:ribokinase [Actinomycetaceae bacterium WB03_NA08]|uniref:Ribokinase n=1 Tax=Scrofimicrobium canadense TaxID=2652290 RepID=A0A6N7W7J6_9ACTO|nr:ribokinase [Scrofimicrobium canadense]MSS84118.1 ribokinase [Scrofimicrobium canadense]
MLPPTVGPSRSREHGDATLLVVGSANLDIVAHAERIPAPGETLLGTEVLYLPGGKGLNQACAAGAVYPLVHFIGSVGSDNAGDQLSTRLTEYGVNIEHLLRSDQSATGTAHISVDTTGMNSIIVVPAANADVTSEHVEQAFTELDDLTGCVTVLQGEIPPASSLWAAELTYERGGRTVLNLAPVTREEPALLTYADPLIVNEYEAGILLDADAPESWEDAEIAAENLLATSPSAIVTLGSMGSVVACRLDEGSIQLTRIEATPIDHPVDSTGAGDAFVGVLAAGLCQGKDLVEAAQAASYHAAMTVEVPGASESYSVLRTASGDTK